ncbi:MAG: UDP-N-acetylmuramoyl-L-alanyl-D-glutamate--2,6-diaminopimelate ligase [Dethiobacter sp.]|jgi:UDP-N-acetylmuramoyl-L-alanyl-D-glutamate--2,6-diaminopimelate ligase|nr:UDP-N-acetylmuramoyl-L-alanyl-D-glutamate--2,6-diaminopimelate ligase [Dethiobacter sp.]
MNLKNLLSDYPIQSVTGYMPASITGFTSDSKRVAPGMLYVCIRGMKEDGHRFASEAVANGAASIVAERCLPVSVPLLRVDDTRHFISFLAHRYYGEPSHKVRVTGITGTNGKTTTAHYLHEIYRKTAIRSALMGTMGVRVGEEYLKQSLTTPEADELHKILWKLNNDGVRTVAMEVSSHALAQKRVEHCRFSTAVFTNLSRDHLDYHGSMERYLAAKAHLFTLLEQNGGNYAVINADDRYGARLLDLDAKNVWTYGIRNKADVNTAELLGITGGGTFVSLKHPDGEISFTVYLHGLYNVYNAMAAATAALAEGIGPDIITAGIESLQNVPGRLELLPAPPGIKVFIDYAHTPDGLKKVLQAVKEYPHRKIILVFGCRGNRDRGKRPLMGRIAEQYAHTIVLTSDNPADENPEAIAGEIAADMQQHPVVIADREQAIHHAVSIALPGDIVLITGKGRENYQLIGSQTIPYSDSQAVNSYPNH